jgi:parallel beta-helix repeat protein
MTLSCKFWKRFMAKILFIVIVMAFWDVTQVFTSHYLNPALTSGRISENTTWTLPNSPYVISSDVIVDSGITLTIESGVAIRFDGNYSIIVNGTLHARGMADVPIIFTSNRPRPSAGDWNAIRFMGAPNESLLIKNSIISYAKTGILIQSLGNATIENSKIVNNLVSGIHVVGKSKLTIKENIIEFNGNGVSSSGEKVSGISIIGNSIRFNENGMYLQAWASRGAVISNITISRNIVNFNKKGIYFYIWAGFVDFDTSLIYDILISENEASLNEHGVYLYSGGPWYGCIYNVLISGNKILSNKIGAHLYANTHYMGMQFDVTILENIVSKNKDIGLYISGDVSRPIEQGIKTNITRNSISYNGDGVLYDGDTENVAHFNDIYSNTYGMNVTDGAAVNAKNNYWGDIDGPYHPSLNSKGRGNPVNGNGVDLEFSPFLTSPTVNALTVTISLSAEIVHSNENLTINVHVTDGVNPVSEVDVSLHSNNDGVFSLQTGKTNSTGDFTALFTAPSVTEQKVIVITANASKEGYWNGQSQRHVTIFPKATTLWFDSIWIIVAMVLPIVLIIVFVAKKRRSKLSHFPKPFKVSIYFLLM